jgi:hypothetical protein
VCQRMNDTMTVLDEGAPEHVAETDRLIRVPCTPGCQGRHLRLWAEPGRLHVERGYDIAPELDDSP